MGLKMIFCWSPNPRESIHKPEQLNRSESRKRTMEGGGMGACVQDCFSCLRVETVADESTAEVRGDCGGIRGSAVLN